MKLRLRPTLGGSSLAKGEGHLEYRDRLVPL
jgi:hypothetical protein